MTGAVVLSGTATAVAVLLLVPVLRGPGRGGASGPIRRWAPALLVAATVGVVVADRPRLLVVAAVLAAAVLAATRLWARSRADREAARVRGQVIAMCDAVRAELAAGLSPAAALDHAAADWPLLGPVARTAAAGGGVPGALREAALVPGAGDLRVVAAGWQVAHRTGHGLADALDRIAEGLRSADATRRVVAGELASARATARLVAVLPLAALLLGSGTGADPWAFLFGTPLGLGCLAGGVAFGLAGLAWIEAIAAGVERDR